MCVGGAPRAFLLTQLRIPIPQLGNPWPYCMMPPSQMGVPLAEPSAVAPRTPGDAVSLFPQVSEADV